MVTTDEDNVVRGEVTEADRLGNIRRVVEVGVERVEHAVTGRDARHSSSMLPIILVTVTLICLLIPSPGTLLLGGVMQLYLMAWVVGSTRR